MNVRDALSAIRTIETDLKLRIKDLNAEISTKDALIARNEADDPLPANLVESTLELANSSTLRFAHLEDSQGGLFSVLKKSKKKQNGLWEQIWVRHTREASSLRPAFGPKLTSNTF